MPSASASGPIQAESELAMARDLLNGRREDPRIDMTVVRDGFNATLASAKRLRAAANTEQKVLSAAKTWLEMLSPDAALEPVETSTDGLELADIRSRKQAAAAEIKTLRSVPTPSSDLRERIQGYVEQLAHAGRPDVRGVEGGDLKVKWPSGPSANRRDLSGFGDSGNPLLMAAFLQPELLVERLMGTVTEMVSRPLPPAQRTARIAELSTERDWLARAESALVDKAIAEAGDGADETHDVDASSEMVLGCRVRAAATSAAA